MIESKVVILEQWLKEREKMMVEESKAIIKFLNCDYELIPNKNKPNEIINRFNVLSEEGKVAGFYPLIIVPSDVLSESLESVLVDNNIENTPERIASIRQTAINTINGIDGKMFLSSRLDELLKSHNDSSIELLGNFTQSSPQNMLNLYMPYSEIIIAKIPAKNPWELAVWMPMGGFNDCPMPEEQAAVFRYWYERYGAIPAAVTYDTWQIVLTKPPLTKDEAEALAKEQFAFCSDIIYQGAETIRELASALKNSTTWVFWWD